MPSLRLFTGTRHLAQVLTVPPTKACILCATPAGMDLYMQAMPVSTYRVQSPGFPKIVYYAVQTFQKHSVQGRFGVCETKTYGPFTIILECTCTLSSPIEGFASVRIAWYSYDYSRVQMYP